MSETLFTIGHGTVPAEALVALLQRFGVRSVVDVRRFPGSERYPQFNSDALAATLATAGVGYRWEERMGGRRGVLERPPRDVALRNSAFRNYAAHMRTSDFRAAARELLDEAAASPTAVMCSESLWWKCHRRLVADYATLLAGSRVEHLMHDGKARPHVITSGVRHANDELIYDQAADEESVALRPDS